MNDTKIKMSDMDKYLTYLLEKYIIYEQNNKCYQNEIDNIDQLKKFIKITDVTKKLNDIVYIQITNDILKDCGCFNIIDIDFEERITNIKSGGIFQQYKMYKQNNCKVEQPKKQIKKNGGKIFITKGVDTMLTEYIDSLDEISSISLKNIFGEPELTGTDGDKFRYEYKILFEYNKNSYIYSIYDYVNSKGVFYEKDDIYWHIATECKDKKTNQKFINEFCKFVKSNEFCS